MKVLVFDEWLPWPLETGKKIRSFNLMRRLAAEHEIHYLAFARAEEESKARVLRQAGIETILVSDRRTPKWTPQFYGRVALNVFSREPFSSAYHLVPPFTERLKEAAQSLSPDLVHCEWSNLAPALAAIDPAVPTAISAHNVESEIWDRYAQSSGAPWIRFMARQQARRIRTLERHWYPRAAMTVTVSERDARVIGSYGATTAIVENGVDLEYYEGHRQGAEAVSNRLVFVASMDTFANQDGAIYLAQEILPRVRARQPVLELKLVGKSPPARLRRLEQHDPAIEVTGTVADVREYLQRASVSVVPLRIGGGSRLKILEAMAMALPVVSTSVGAEGLRVTHGQDILLADDADSFAAAVTRLLDSPRERLELGRAGLDLVRRHYSWATLASLHDRAWRDAATRKRQDAVGAAPVA